MEEGACDEERDAEGEGELEEVGRALGLGGDRDAEGGPFDRVLGPFAIGEHAGEHAVVGEVCDLLAEKEPDGEGIGKGFCVVYEVTHK